MFLPSGHLYIRIKKKRSQSKNRNCHFHSIVISGWLFRKPIFPFVTLQTYLGLDSEVEEFVPGLKVEGLAKDQNRLGLGSTFQRELSLFISGHDRVLDLGIGAVRLVPVQSGNPAEHRKA